MSSGHKEGTPGGTGWVQGCLLGHKVCSGHSVCPQSKVMAGPWMMGKMRGGCDSGEHGRSPRVSRCCIWVQDFLGQAFVALGEVIGSQRGRLERPLT